MADFSFYVINNLPNNPKLFNLNGHSQNKILTGLIEAETKIHLS